MVTETRSEAGVRTVWHQWRIRATEPAQRGWQVCWFVDPDKPARLPIAMWASCRRLVERKLEGTRLKVVASTFDEDMVLPLVAFGGTLELVDDADAITSPSVSLSQLTEDFGSEGSGKRRKPERIGFGFGED